METTYRLIAVLVAAFLATSFLAAVPRTEAGHLPGAPPLRTSFLMAAGHPGAATNVGVAFDGTTLYVTGSGSTIHLYSPVGVETGHLLATRQYGALAYDATRDQIWACYVGSPLTIERIDKATGAVLQTIDVSALGPHFTFCDGLAFDARAVADPSDDVLYYSPDVSPTIYRLNAITGALIDSFPFAPINEDGVFPVGGCGNSGIAVGGPDVWLSDNGCDHIYRADKPPTTKLASFNSVGGTRPEDMECDDKTFAPDTVIWVRTFEDNTLRAYDAPNPCGVGGVPPPPDGRVPEFGAAAALMASLAAIPIVGLRQLRSHKKVP